jgi:uncharacterized damage-inducible protein DinB
MSVPSQKIGGTSAVGEAFLAKAREFLAADYLPKIERSLEILSDEQIWWRSNPESNSIGNLMLHLSGNARQWIVSGVGGANSDRDRPQEFAERSLIPRDELIGRLRETLADVDEVLRLLDPATLLQRRTIQGCDVTVLEAIFHVVEHFSMHTGQIILLAKMLTGRDLAFYDFSSGAPTPSWGS